MQLFEGAGPGATFNLSGIGSHMQFGAVAAAFGQQPQQQFGMAGGVDWSSPAPSPPPHYVPAPPLPPAAVLGPGGMQQHMQYGQAGHTAAGQRHVMAGVPAGGPVAAYPGMLGHPGASQPPAPPARPPRQLEDPAAALPDDVFDVPAPQPPLSHGAGPGQHYPGQGAANGQQRTRGYGGQPRGRQRGQRFPQPQQQHPQHPHVQMAYAPPGHYPAGFPTQMPGW